MLTLFSYITPPPLVARLMTSFIPGTLPQAGQTVMGHVVSAPASNPGPGRLNAFLNYLLDLSQKSVSSATHSELISLIQQLIDRKISLEDFYTQLQAKLKSGTTSTYSEISSLVEKNIDSLRCDLHYGTFQIPGITPPSKETIADLLQKYPQPSATVSLQAQNQVVSAQTGAPRFTASPNATLVASAPQQQRFIASPAVSAPRATFYTNTVPAGSTIVSTASGTSGPKYFISSSATPQHPANIIVSLDFFK
ncbi:Transcription initiation factor TFIID subunit 4B [Cichlidogyrus casuarinus]|uniref:Transcription initiation factor TFIID subunit 4B n=1 Tax=Cichlidogyrus casuarinus TaxID=1844966 RepID=A0ABD2QG98_9PLAT